MCSHLFTILTFQIDADALSGICFPGFNNIWVRLGYIIAPIVTALTVGSVFSIRGKSCKKKDPLLDGYVSQMTNNQSAILIRPHFLGFL